MKRKTYQMKLEQRRLSTLLSIRSEHFFQIRTSQCMVNGNIRRVEQILSLHSGFINFTKSGDKTIQDNSQYTDLQGAKGVNYWLTYDPQTNETVSFTLSSPDMLSTATRKVYTISGNDLRISSSATEADFFVKE